MNNCWAKESEIRKLESENEKLRGIIETLRDALERVEIFKEGSYNYPNIQQILALTKV